MDTKKQIGFGDWFPSKSLAKYLRDILKTRRLTYGKYSQALETLFSKYTGNEHIVFCSSGTAALYSAIAVLKNENPVLAKERKYIVLPSTTFISDVNVVVANGFIPVFVDVMPNYNISYSELESCLKKYDRQIFAVMPSSLMGRPVDGERIRQLIDDYAKGTFFILDNCENIYSKYNNQYPESFADITAWSGYISHLLISGASGGFIGTNNAKLAIKLRSYINHGRCPSYTSIDDDNDVNEATLKDITANRFKFIQHGLNFRLGETEAAFALSMLEDNFEGQLLKRKKNAEKLIKGLSHLPIILPKFAEMEEARHMMLPIRLGSGDKWPLVHHLEANGVETRDVLPLYQPITEKYFGTKIDFRTNHPMSYEILERAFYIGCHQYLTDEDINYIIETFNKFFTK